MKILILFDKINKIMKMFDLLKIIIDNLSIVYVYGIQQFVENDCN